MTVNNPSFDVVVIGAGAAGLMSAIEAGRRGRSVLVLEKAEKIGKKILISGGGRCNFTNLFAAPDKYLSSNPHFCKSAFRQYTQQDFIDLVKRHDVGFHEKKLGQLFCDEGAAQITRMLEKECEHAGVTIWCGSGADDVNKMPEGGFLVRSGSQHISCETVVVATGGLSIPKMGANDFAHRLANRFALDVTDMKPGLVPFTFEGSELKKFDGLSGVSADVTARLGKAVFRENVLFTHRGMSGPAILQISSFWEEGEVVLLDFLPDESLFGHLKEERGRNPKGKIRKYLSDRLAARLAEKLLAPLGDLPELGNCSDKLLRKIDESVKQVEIRPSGTEGYKKAEVTVGGVSTACLNSKTMEAKSVPGLYFIGEAVDVTGFLGGYNFQWAWSSGYVAGQHA